MALVRRLIETSEAFRRAGGVLCLCAGGGGGRLVLDEIADRLLLNESNHFRGHIWQTNFHLRDRSVPPVLQGHPQIKYCKSSFAVHCIIIMITVVLSWRTTLFTSLWG
jgi:hypothetical protein